MSVALTKQQIVCDSLALLALKVAPNVFDLSSMQHHASIRDQIVRAELLIRDLCNADKNFDSVLVVGTGIAGITAAMAAAAEGKRVVVVGVEAEPFGLQAKVNKRFVGPFMYEWPSVFSGDQTYPPSDLSIWPSGPPYTPAWTSNTPIAASALAALWTTWLCDALTKMKEENKDKEIYKKKAPPTFWLKLDGMAVNAVKAFVTKFAKQTGDNMKLRLDGKSHLPLNKQPLTLDFGYTDWPAGSKVKGPVTFMPDYVILAAGMGEETTELAPKNGSGAKGLRFWADDNLLDRDSTERQIGLFGGGDGALQDALRVLTGLNDPLEILNRLEDDPLVRRAIRKVIPKLLVIEQQSRLTDSWTLTPGMFAHMDRACQSIANVLAKKKSVRDGIYKILRSGDGLLQHFVKGDHFGKAYLLNRFLVHLINECCQHKRWKWDCRMKYRLIFDAMVKSSGDLPLPCLRRHWVKIRLGKPPTIETHEFDLVIVRFGIEYDSISGLQMIQISGQDKGMRTSLAHVPVPFTVS